VTVWREADNHDLGASDKYKIFDVFHPYHLDPGVEIDIEEQGYHQIQKLRLPCSMHIDLPTSCMRSPFEISCQSQVMFSEPRIQRVHHSDMDSPSTLRGSNTDYQP